LSQSSDTIFNRERALEVMDKNGLDALVATTPENIYYVSGYGNDHSFHFRPQGFGCAIFPRESDVPPTLIVQSWELPVVVEEKTWMPEVRVQYTFDLCVDPDAALYPEEERLRDLWLSGRAGSPNRQRVLGQTLRDLGLADGRLGFDDVRVMLELKENELENADVSDALNIFRQIRVVKTPGELQCLGRSAAILESALVSMSHLAGPGTTIQELFRFLRATVALHGGYVSHGIGTGVNRPWISYSRMDYRLQDGDILYVDPAGQVDFYWADIGRTLVVGQAPPKLEPYYEALVDCHEEVVPLLTPGRSTAEIKSAAGKAVSGRLPLEGFAPLVHSIGLEQYDHPQPVGDFLGADFVLEEGMVVNFETPFLELGFGILQLENTYVVESGGPRRLTTLPPTPLRSGRQVPHNVDSGRVKKGREHGSPTVSRSEGNR
jgi:Xaa-Pro dipeptidase